jgi:pyruvate-formate lyase-activating enzyme
MDTRRTESRRGTIKARKDLQGRYCLQPFTNVDIHSNGGVRCCSESWMPAWIGDFSERSLREIWNGEVIQGIRRSVIEGTYQHCDFHQCPFYCNEEFYLYTRENLEDPRTAPAGHHRTRLEKYAPWIRFLLEGKTRVDLPPANYNLAYDETCNLACPSCRSSTVVHARGPELEKRMAIHAKLLAEVEENGLDAVGRFNLTGSGEPFASRVFTDFLFHFDGRRWPNLDVNLQSNGLLFTPRNWERMWKLHGNVNEVIISLDASRPETYAQIRVNGDHRKLLDNLEFMAGLRREGRIRRLMLAYVVQRQNYREMRDAVHIAHRLGSDLILFNLVTDWMSWPRERFEAEAVWKEYHPEYPDFLEALRDPVFDDPLADLGNVLEYRRLARSGRAPHRGET